MPTRRRREPGVLSPGDPARPSTWQGPPSWLLVPPLEPPPPPVRPRPALLPISTLHWEDFERLCLRLLHLEADRVHVDVYGDRGTATAPVTRGYGTRGQAQAGIDVYSRDPLRLGELPEARRYVVLQARNVKKVTKTALRNAVKDFTAGKWASVTRKFIYATSLSGVETEFSDEIEAQAAVLAKSGIELAVWDAEALTDRLRGLPEVVDDFFHRQWVAEFCGPDAAAALGNRLSAEDTALLRRELARVYAAAFGVADSGHVALRLGPQRTVAIRDRFVTPDVLTVPDAAAATITMTTEDTAPSEPRIDPAAIVSEASIDLPSSRDGDPNWSRGARIARQPTGAASPDRRSADAWLGHDNRQVVVGDMGTGKSTLLRYLVLDLLSDAPHWSAVAERWGQRLPVWLPFHFFTQRVAGQTGVEASIGAALKAWLDQHDVGDLWSLVEAALRDDRLLLVVDGLDEWVSDDAGSYAATAVDMFANTHAAAVVVATRPYGLAKLALGAGWNYARLAPLSIMQQRELAQHYFRLATTTGDTPPADEVLAHTVDDFLRDVHSQPDLRAISSAPLFLVLLIALRLSNVAKLPERRHEVYDHATTLLIGEHPARRRAAAAVTTVRKRLDDRQVRNVLAEIAFESQERGDVSTITEQQIRTDFIKALQNPQTLDLNHVTAGASADELLNVAEGELGVIVRKGPREFGFLHRMLQEQLAAEYVADRLAPSAQQELFDARVGDPQWREVLLAVLWRLNRPDEVRALVEVIHRKIDETPAGLRAREMFAEVVFGPYPLPATDARRAAPELIEVAETHPYGPHRQRLVERIVNGLDNLTTGELVDAALTRWTLQIEPASAAVVRRVAQVPAHPDLSDTIVTMLLRAVRYPDVDVAYGAAVAIASRVTDNKLGTEQERASLYAGLFALLHEPPSALTQAAALTALAMGWQHDDTVAATLINARTREGAVKLVALADALGALHEALLGEERAVETDGAGVTDDERTWLAASLDDRGDLETHRNMLIATIAAAFRDDPSFRTYCVHRIREGTGYDLNLIWPVALRAFPDDDDLVAAVCDQLRAKERSWIMIGFGVAELLGSAYANGALHRSTVAMAIEDHLAAFGDEHRERQLSALAAIDQGPQMRGALLRDLSESGVPHWAAGALADHFLTDPAVAQVLRETLAGDPIRASKIAYAAPRVLTPNDAADRLLTILRDIAPAGWQGRRDIVTYALIDVCEANGWTSGSRAEPIINEALMLMPAEAHDLYGDPSYSLAVAFYPAASAQVALDRLAQNPRRALAPFLDAYRDDPTAIRPFLDDALDHVRTLRARDRQLICEHLANLPTACDTVMRLTRGWADETSEFNKSTASLAFHRALREAYRAGAISDDDWEEARRELATQAAIYGYDHEARRQAAWVGMCVIEDWSLVDDAVESIGDARPVGVPLTSGYGAPNVLLLHQLAEHWEQLRAHFGADLAGRLSGLRPAEDHASMWSALALVAADSPALHAEVEDAVASNPDLLKEEGVLAWFVARPVSSAATTLEVLLLDRLTATHNARNVATHLLAVPERVRVDEDELRRQLEARTIQASAGGGWGNPALEILAARFPEHPLVSAAWQRFSDIVSTPRDQRVPYDDPHPETYLAVAYAATPSDRVLAQIERDRGWISENGNSFFEDAFVRHVSRRLRRDSEASTRVHAHITDPDTSDADAATYASLLAAAVAVDSQLASDLQRRAERQVAIGLATVVRDPVISASVSVDTVLNRVADTTAT